MSLSEKRVLITGGASGIGAATAELFASRGATIVVADVSEEAGREVVATLGDRHRFVQLDVSSKDAWDDKMAEIAEDGVLDIAFLNAGVMTRPRGELMFNDPLQWITPANMERLIGVNLYGVLWGVLACLPYVSKSSGTIMATSSGAALTPFAMDPTYTMTKYGVNGLMCSLAPTLEEQHVRIVTVCPHAVDTAIRPPDLHEKKLRDGYSSPPSHMAESVLYIYDRAKPGDVWQSRAGEMPYLIEPPEQYFA